MIVCLQIVDTSQILDSVNLGRRLEMQWPREEWKQNGGKNSWGDWVPRAGMEGTVVHRWTPNHRDLSKRSHLDKTILLVQLNEHYVPISESGVADLGAEV